MTPTASAPAILAGMDQPPTLRVILEFEQGADPPRGRLLAGQTVHPFTGWLGLATALELATGADTSTPPSPAPPPSR